MPRTSDDSDTKAEDGSGLPGSCSARINHLFVHRGTWGQARGSFLRGAGCEFFQKQKKF